MSNPRSTVLTGVLIWCSCASFALAVDTSWNAGVSDWSNPSNWSAGEPNQVNRAVISNGGTALIGTGEETNGMIVGWNAGQSGAIRIEDETDSLTSFGVNAVVRIGFSGSGSAFHSAG